MVYTVSYNTDQQEQRAIRVTSEPDLIIEVSFQTRAFTFSPLMKSLLTAFLLMSLLSAYFLNHLLLETCLVVFRQFFRKTEKNNQTEMYQQTI